MNTFHSLLCLMGSTHVVKERVDLVTRLPLELASIIFRKLDDRSLFSASMVDYVWMKIIRSDRVLKTRLRSYLRASRECDPLNLRRFVGMGQCYQSRRANPKGGRCSEFTSASTFRIAERGEVHCSSKPLKRRRVNDNAIHRKIKIMRY